MAATASLPIEPGVHLLDVVTEEDAAEEDTRVDGDEAIANTAGQSAEKRRGCLITEKVDLQTYSLPGHTQSGVQRPAGAKQICAVPSSPAFGLA